MLSSSKITKKPNKETTQVIPVQERSGLYLIVEPKPSKCKRFEGRMRYPRGRSGKTQYIALGAFFKTRTKKIKYKADITILNKIKKSINLPVVAIGGINEKNYKKLLLNKADFLAISSYIWNNKNFKPYQAIKKLI